MAASYLRMSLDDGQAPRPVRLLGIGPEEVTVLCVRLVAGPRLVLRLLSDGPAVGGRPNPVCLLLSRGPHRHCGAGRGRHAVFYGGIRFQLLRKRCRQVTSTKLRKDEATNYTTEALLYSPSPISAAKSGMWGHPLPLKGFPQPINGINGAPIQGCGPLKHATRPLIWNPFSGGYTS